jgi:hypothetical protein
MTNLDRVFSSAAVVHDRLALRARQEIATRRFAPSQAA